MPYHRLFNSPISESAIVGSAVGYAMAGGRALVELMYCDFLACAGDEVFNQMAKWQAMSADIIKMPVVLRVSVGSKYGAQHSQDWSALAAHIPGLKLAFPATPYDAKGLMASALVGTDPVVFFESQRIYDVGEQFHEGGVPKDYYEIPFGKADVKRKGKDITILTFGAVLYRAIKAADELKEKYGMEAEIIDARTLVPFDYDTVIESVKKTGRIVIVTDACERGSFASEVARQITEMAFDELDAPPVVVASKNWITPAHELEEAFFPQPSWILDAIDAKIVPLKDMCAPPTRPWATSSRTSARASKTQPTAYGDGRFARPHLPFQGERPCSTAKNVIASLRGRLAPPAAACALCASRRRTTRCSSAPCAPCSPT